MPVEVYRELRGGRLAKRRPPRPWSYFQHHERPKDPSTRYNPTTAISDEVRWHDFIEGPITAIIVPLLLFLAGLIRMGWYYVLIFFWVMVSPRSVVIVERDGQVIERHEVVGRLESIRLIRQLRSRYASTDR